METIVEILARELDQSPRHVGNVVDLLDEGNTIPFIARYRKELHGSMDDTTLRTLEERCGPPRPGPSGIALRSMIVQIIAENPGKGNGNFDDSRQRCMKRGSINFPVMV